MPAELSILKQKILFHENNLNTLYRDKYLPTVIWCMMEMKNQRKRNHTLAYGKPYETNMEAK